MIITNIVMITYNLSFGFEVNFHSNKNNYYKTTPVLTVLDNFKGGQITCIFVKSLCRLCIDLKDIQSCCHGKENNAITGILAIIVFLS